MHSAHAANDFRDARTLSEPGATVDRRKSGRGWVEAVSKDMDWKDANGNRNGNGNGIGIGQGVGARRGSIISSLKRLERFANVQWN